MRNSGETAAMQKHVGPERRTLLAIRAPRREPYHSSGASRHRRAFPPRPRGTAEKEKARRMISRIGIAVLVLLAIVLRRRFSFRCRKSM